MRANDTTEPRRFAPPEALALDPRSLGVVLLQPYVATTTARDGVIVLSVRGPLMQFRDVFCDSYEAIVERVVAALESKPRAIVLSIASPGGVFAGSLEAAQQIRSLCVRADVPLVAYADGAACSAGYALACAAPHIVAPPSATVGSIGVLAEVVDSSARNAQQGLAVRLVRSGARKADGSTPELVSGPALQNVDAMVRAMGATFGAFVERMRGVPAGRIAALEGATLLAGDARAAGLVDDVRTLDELLDLVVSATAPSEPSAAVPPALPDAPTAPPVPASPNPPTEEPSMRSSSTPTPRPAKSDPATLKLAKDLGMAEIAALGRDLTDGEWLRVSTIAIARVNGLPDPHLLPSVERGMDRAMGIVELADAPYTKNGAVHFPLLKRGGR